MKTVLIVTISILFLLSCATPTQVSSDAEVRRLCAIDGGIKVYETVKLPADRFDKWGHARIASKDRARPADEYYFESDVVNVRIGNPRIIRTVYKIVRRSDRKVLGTATWYGRSGGDPPGPWHPSSFVCPPISSEAPSLESRVFVIGESK
jgi:hypothetical protein